jgi:hypothetical protein
MTLEQMYAQLVALAHEIDIDTTVLPESTHNTTTTTPVVIIPQEYLQTYRRAKNV